jgi:uncharacterized membrane protein (UPF0127 family)
MKKKILPFVIVVAFFALALGLVKSNQAVYQEKYITIAGQNIKIELAKSDAEKEKGLSGHAELRPDEGMLFVFQKPDIYAFWMKDMNFPIDIIWLSEDMKVVYIKKDARPESYPGAFTPDQKAKYVLEVSSGFSEKNNLKIGDSAEFSYK